MFILPGWMSMLNGSIVDHSQPNQLQNYNYYTVVSVLFLW